MNVIDWKPLVSALNHLDTAVMLIVLAVTYWQRAWTYAVWSMFVPLHIVMEYRNTNFESVEDIVAILQLPILYSVVWLWLLWLMRVVDQRLEQRGQIVMISAFVAWQLYAKLPFVSGLANVAQLKEWGTYLRFRLRYELLSYLILCGSLLLIGWFRRSSRRPSPSQ